MEKFSKDLASINFEHCNVVNTFFFITNDEFLQVWNRQLSSFGGQGVIQSQ